MLIQERSKHFNYHWVPVYIVSNRLVCILLPGLVSVYLPSHLILEITCVTENWIITGVNITSPGCPHSEIQIIQNLGQTLSQTAKVNRLNMGRKRMNWKKILSDNFSDRFFRSEKLLLSCFCFLLSFYGCFIWKVTIWEPVTLSWGKWHSSLKLSIYFTSGSLPQMEETWLRRNFITIRTIWCVSACLQLFILGNDLRIIPAVPGSRPQIDNPGLLRRAGAVPGCGSLSFTFISDHPWTLTSRPEVWDSLLAKSVVFIRPDCLQSPASPVNRLWDAPQVNVCPRQTNRLLKIVCRFPLLKRESWLHN